MPHLRLLPEVTMTLISTARIIAALRGSPGPRRLGGVHLLQRAVVHPSMPQLLLDER
jgi:hypothetical protein